MGGQGLRSPLLITMFAWEWLLRGVWLRPLCAHSGPTLDSLEAPKPKMAVD